MPEKVRQCALCGAVMEKRHVFVCPECKKGPLCPSHRDPDLKICESCASERRFRAIGGFEKSRSALRAMLRLSEFVFVSSAALFTAMRFIPGYVPFYLSESFLARNVCFWGWGSAGLIAVLFITIKIIGLSKRSLERKMASVKIYKRV